MMLRNSSRYWWLLWAGLGLITIGTIAVLRWLIPSRFSADVFAAAETVSTDPKMVEPAAQRRVTTLIETLAKERGSVVRVEIRPPPPRGQSGIVSALKPPHDDPGTPHIYTGWIGFKFTAEGKTPDEALSAAQQASDDAKLIYSRLPRKHLNALRKVFLALPPTEEKARHAVVLEMERFEMRHALRSSEFPGSPYIRVSHAIQWKPFLPDSFSISNFILATLIAVSVAFCSHRLSSRLLALRPL